MICICFTVLVSLHVGLGCILQGAEIGVCDFRLDPNFIDRQNNWGKWHTRQYRRWHLPNCRWHVKYPACVPEMEDIDSTLPIISSDRWRPKRRVPASDEYPYGRFQNLTIRNKDIWVHFRTQQIIDERLGNESNRKLERKEMNEYSEGECEGRDSQRCKKYPICKSMSGSACHGYPIQARMTRNQDCQRAFEAYFCYINFPRCYYDITARVYRSTQLCRSACKNFFKACNYDKSLWRCGKADYFNAEEREDFESFNRYVRDVFPGQPFRNSHKKRGYRNIEGRCTPSIRGGGAPQQRSAIVSVAVALSLALALCVVR
mmetsp:Transcript_11041/g.33111  ORF Transcript_11041/g.33111 Transcript_11041/m.33111 type:complete len:317 (-) Transcript_11041:812-1762(-)